MPVKDFKAPEEHPPLPCFPGSGFTVPVETSGIRSVTVSAN